MLNDDELAALDAAQMEADMARAQVGPDAWAFPRQMTPEEDDRVLKYLGDRYDINSILTVGRRDATHYLAGMGLGNGPIYIDGKPI